MVNKETSKEVADEGKISVPSTLSLRHTLRGHKDMILSIAWSPDGSLLASCSDDKTIRLWDGQKGKVLFTLEGHTDNVLGLSFSPDGHFLASKSQDGNVRLWRAPSWEMIELLE